MDAKGSSPRFMGIYSRDSPSITSQLDSSRGEFLTSTWKDLDSKFLSNDSLTNSQKMLQPVTPSDRLDHILNHTSMYVRAADLIVFIDNVDTFHLKQNFQLLIEAIFGYNSKYPAWPFRSITKTVHPREAGAISKLLGSTGPLLNFATKLLEDPSFVIEIGLERLPFVLSQRILQGDIPPYFSNRLCFSDAYPLSSMASPMIKCLRLNAFEFYFLSFSGHICSLAGVGNTSSDYLVGWGSMSDNLYNNLLDDYLSYFFPCTGTGVPSDNFRLSYQQVNDSMYMAHSLRTQTSHDASGISYEGGSPRLLKASLLMEQAHLPSNRGDAFFRKTQAQKEVWRSETIMLICTEMWMAHAPGANSSQNSSPVSTDQFGKVMLPTVDVVKAVRMLVRHSHFFLNCISACVMHPMEELKRDVYPTYQKRTYKFLRHLFFNWPLDNSFRIVYETWLSYIQPWRYVQYERTRLLPNGKDAAEAPVDSRWYGFLQENILFYTKIFNIMLSRMSRVEFATIKNALMFYRVAKVYTSPEYLKIMLRDIDFATLNFEQPYPNQINGLPNRSPTPFSSPYGHSRMSSGEAPRGSAMFRIASLRQIMKDWETCDFIYEPIFSEHNKKIISGLIDTTKLAKDQLQELIEATMTQQKRNQSWWDKLLGTNKQYNAVVGQSIAELNKAINQLDFGKNQLANFFDIPVVDQPEVRAPVFTPTRLPRTSFIGSDSDGSMLDGTENRITVLPSGIFNCDMLVPVGNPDFSSVRSDECDIVLKYLRILSGILNDRFAGDTMRLYFQKNWKGRLVRAAVAQPVEYFDIEKRGRIREKVRKVLPPRISLRFFSSLNVLMIITMIFMVSLLFGVKCGVVGVMLISWVIFVIIRAITEPEKKLDDLIYLFGNRNYNVDFRGRRERIDSEHE